MVGVPKCTVHSTNKLSLPLFLFLMWCLGNLRVWLHIFYLLSVISIRWLENPLLSWLNICILSMFGPPMYPALLPLPDSSLHIPNGFQTSSSHPYPRLRFLTALWPQVTLLRGGWLLNRGFQKQSSKDPGRATRTLLINLRNLWSTASYDTSPESKKRYSQKGSLGR